MNAVRVDIGLGEVLDNAAIAAAAIAEFGYELNLTGRPRRPRASTSNPGPSFFNDAELDFAMVAVEPAPFSGNTPMTLSKNRLERQNVRTWRIYRHGRSSIFFAHIIRHAGSTCENFDAIQRQG